MNIEQQLKAASTEGWYAYQYLKTRCAVDPTFAEFISWQENEKYSLPAKFYAPLTPQGGDFWEKVNDQIRLFLFANNLRVLGSFKPLANNFLPLKIYRGKSTILTKTPYGYWLLTGEGRYRLYGKFYNSQNYDYIEAAAATFYLLQELKLLKPKKTVPCARNFKQWHETLTAFESEFTKKLAKSLRDCMALMTMGEVRHSCHRAEYIGPWNFTDYDNKNKLFLYKRILPNLHWKDVEQTIPVFLDYAWEESYGGELWATIAEKTLTYSRRSPTTFCDAVFGLVHNGGIAFDKGYMISSADKSFFEEFLNLRRQHSILTIDVPNYNYPYPLDSRAYWLLVDAVKMGLVDLDYWPEVDMMARFENIGTMKLMTVDWKGKDIEDV